MVIELLSHLGYSVLCLFPDRKRVSGVVRVENGPTDADCQGGQGRGQKVF